MRRFTYALSFLLPRLGYDRKIIDLAATPENGDLVILVAAPPTVWHISIFIEKENDGRYVLESLQTGELCRWDNVGLNVLSREFVTTFERIKWTDAMFDFDLKLRKADRKLDLWAERPYIKSFTDDVVQIGIRTRHGFHKLITTFDVPEWQRITIKQLATRLESEVDRYRVAVEADKQDVVPA